MYLVIMAVLIGQPNVPSGEPPYVPGNPPVVPSIVKQAEPARGATYADAYSKALKEGKRLAAFVEAPSREIDGVVTIAVKWEGGFRDYPRGSVVVATVNPSNANELISLGHLDPNVSDEEIRSGGKKAVQPSARPFLGSNKAEQRPLTADDDAKAAGPWPKEVVKPVGMVRYKPTLYTQSIYNQGITDRVSRFLTASKWHQSGGMEGITGFRSDVYKLVPDPGVRESMGIIPVLNSFGRFQNERGHLRSYPDGTIFMDVLSMNGTVFEHRERRKENGNWKSKVIYSNHAARPLGYTGLTVSCASCHDEAGTGGYAAGLVPGGDTVISDKFSKLEAGTSLASAQPQQEFSNVPFSQSLQPSFSPSRGRLRR